MKIAVVGAGAMGSIFGARFHQAGHETVLVDVVQPLVDTINAEGVTVVRGDDETVTRVPATTDPAAVGPVDIVVFFTKCYHTSSAAESARPLVGPDTAVASLQNGWGNGDVLAAAYPPGQVVLGVTYNSGLLQGPGRVLHPAEQPTLVGSFSDGGDGATRLAEALESAGLATTVASPVRPEIWKKLILNAASLPASFSHALRAAFRSCLSIFAPCRLSAHSRGQSGASATALIGTVSSGMVGSVARLVLSHRPSSEASSGCSGSTSFRRRLE